MKKIISIIVVLICVVAFTGCGSNSETTKTEGKDTKANVGKVTVTEEKEDEKEKEPESKSHYPITIENFGKEITFEKAPERIIAMDYNAASTLVALGLKDKIIATREANLLSLDDVDERYRKDVAEIEIPQVYIDNPLPPLEVNLSLKPDFILMDSYYFNVPNVFGEYEDYVDNGVKILVTEGSMDKVPEIDDMYVDIRKLGKIFDVENRAEDLCKELESKFNSVKSKVNPDNKYKVMGYDGGEDSPIVGAGKSLENLLIELAGAENIFKDVDKQFATVGWEDVIAKNPDFIILCETPDDKGAVNLLNILKNNKEISDVTAIKEENFIVVPLRHTFSGIYTVDAFNSIVEGLNK